MFKDHPYLKRKFDNRIYASGYRPLPIKPIFTTLNKQSAGSALGSSAGTEAGYKR